MYMNYESNVVFAVKKKVVVCAVEFVRSLENENLHVKYLAISQQIFSIIYLSLFLTLQALFFLNHHLLDSLRHAWIFVGVLIGSY